MKEACKDTRSTEEMFAGIVDILGLFVFYEYYDGYKTNNTSGGFSLGAGPPGSMNHMRTYWKLFHPKWSKSKF